MSRELELPLFDLRRFVVVNLNLVVGEHQRDFHLDIISRMLNGRYVFGDTKEIEKNRKILEQIMGIDGFTVDMGTVLRVFSPENRSLIEISGRSETFDYPQLTENTSKKRKKTLSLFEKIYPESKFKLVEKHSV